MEELNRRRTEDERRLQELERRLQEAEAVARTAAARAEKAEAAGRASPTATVGSGAVPAAATAKAATGVGAFNPGIGIVLDGKLGIFSEDPDSYGLAGFSLAGEAAEPGQRGFFLGETEINAFANVDDLFFGSTTLALEFDDGET
jgi:hypothetical protein